MTQAYLTSREAISYINRIRNDGKRAYAEWYWLFLTHRAEEQDYKQFGISYMAAQAVRMELAKMLAKNTGVIVEVRP